MVVLGLMHINKILKKELLFFIFLSVKNFDMKRITYLFIVLFSFQGIILCGQNDTIFYFEGDLPVPTKDNADSFKKITYQSDGSFLLEYFLLRKKKKWELGYSHQIIESNDSLLQIISVNQNNLKDTTSRISIRRDTGFFIENYITKNGVNFLESTGMSKYKFPLIKFGSWKEFDFYSHKQTFENDYFNNQIINTKYWVDSTLIIDSVYTVVDKMPEFEGGEQNFQKFLSENIVFPKFAKKWNSGKGIYTICDYERWNYRRS